MSLFMDLAAVSGPDEGMRFTIEFGTYRIIGRYDKTLTATELLTPSGNRALNPDQEEFVEQQALTDGRSSLLSNHRRGPDILLNDSSVSRLHALVLFDESGTTIVDLMSTNGTFVNGLSGKLFRVAPKDRIDLGKTKLQVAIG